MPYKIAGTGIGVGEADPTKDPAYAAAEEKRINKERTDRFLESLTRERPAHDPDTIVPANAFPQDERQAEANLPQLRRSIQKHLNAKMAAIEAEREGNS